LLRPRPSSQPAAASIPDALGGLIAQSVVGIIERAERSLTGASVLWVGESRF
jgi:protease-4